MSDIKHTLAERGARYGKFTDHACIAQALQDAMRNTSGWQRLAVDQKQALTVIADKIARMLNGDPNYVDNWHDIIGYAKLVEDALIERQAFVAEDAKGAFDAALELARADWVSFNPHSGEAHPTGDAKVEVKFRNGDQVSGRAHRFIWGRLPGNEIVAYRIVRPD